MQTTILFTRRVKIAVSGAVLLGIFWLCIAAQSILWPFIAAAITAYVCFPIITWFERRLSIGRGWVIAAHYFIVAGIAAALARWVVPTLWQQALGFQASVPAIIGQIVESMRFLTPWLADRGVSQETVTGQVTGIMGSFGMAVGSTMPAALAHIATTATLAITYIVLTAYFLAQGDSMLKSAVGFLPLAARSDAERLGCNIHRVLQLYIRSQIVMTGIMTLLFFIPLATLQVPYAPLLALMAGCLEIIPILGPWIATISIAAITASQGEYPFFLTAPIAVSFVVGHFLIMRVVQDQFIAPRFFGNTVAVHPVGMIFAVLAGGATLGPVGMLLATPVAAVIQVCAVFLVEIFNRPSTETARQTLPADQEPPDVLIARSVGEQMPAQVARES